MFGRPSIKLEWGEGFQDEVAKSARKSVEQSLEIATDTLKSMGVALQGRKRITVTAREKAALKKVDGVAYSSWQLSLYSSAASRPRNATQTMLYDALTIGHELFHGERMRNFELAGRLERVISEGLAYGGEEQMAALEARLRGIDDRSSSRRRVKPHTIEQLGSALLDSRGDDRDVVWVDKRVEDGLTRAEVLGVSMVHKMLDRGAEFRDLLQLPAEEFIEA